MLKQFLTESDTNSDQPKNILCKVTTSLYFTKAGFTEKRDIYIYKRKSHPGLLECFYAGEPEEYKGLFDGKEDGLYEITCTMKQSYFEPYPEIDKWIVSKVGEKR
jgi:hypothetical protein